MSSRHLFVAATLLCALGLISLRAAAPALPLPEHPRPDFERTAWQNLNGSWQFRFDAQNVGETATWATAETNTFPEQITVPFGWGAKLSGVANQADIGWYRRSITVPEAWRGQRIFLVVGASDWLTKAWIDGHPVGEHRGGYTPFALELTPHVQWGREQQITLRVDDTPHAFKLEGKQGYGDVRGIWQTIYLEARAPVHLTSLHFTPDIDTAQVTVSARFSDPVPAQTTLRLHFKNKDAVDATYAVPTGAREASFTAPIAQPHLWALDDPYLYDVETALTDGTNTDRVNSYFGLRKISVANLPGTSIPYVALNGHPVYLQMTLDQSYHPDGFYTFPSDDFMRDEILRSKQLGLNTNRIHIKVEVPRKLYWADRLGLLIMADVPNSWGEPTPEARAESEFALRGMIERDFNHPAIFSWITFNETWGLFTGKEPNRTYLPETQTWVASMYHLAKQLDPTRLVEDNSACNHDHTETDLNSWHDYLPGYLWREKLDQIERETHAGSTANFIGGRQQGHQPMFNSECGNVWGYEGSTGDVDWSWDYHIMMNEFRRHPKVAGWLYTEHHDVINEWNGYYRFDRTPKFTGLEELASGMSIADLHGTFYLSTGSDLCRDVKPGETVDVPLYASFLTATAPGAALVLRSELYGWDNLGHRETYSRVTRPIAFEPWLTKQLSPLQISMPVTRALAVLTLSLETETGVVLHRNFTTFAIGDGVSPRDELKTTPGGTLRIVRFAPASFTSSHWSQKQWNVLDGLKVDGAGHGFFEYRLPWPKNLEAGRITGAAFLCEASAKQLFGKDRAGAVTDDGDFMRGKGTHDPSSNPNAYPMTDTTPFPSAVRVRINGLAAGTANLPDDPADHRGILSWHAQPRDKHLREAGSYGYLMQVVIPQAALEAAQRAGEIILRLEVDAALPGGLALYGERFGRYPIDPSFVFQLK